jgi:translocation and assembly module TamB
MKRRNILLVTMMVLIVVAGVYFFLAAPWGNSLLRSYIAGRIESATGATVQLGRVRFGIWPLNLELNNLTLHGSEKPSDPPLFHVDRLHVRFRVLSFLGHRIALEELTANHPSLVIRVDSKGHSNIPVGKPGNKTFAWRDTLLALRIHKFALYDGTLTYNDQTIPLNVAGENFNFSLNAQESSPGNVIYAGNLTWPAFVMTRAPYAPFQSDLLAKFTLHYQVFTIEELIWKLPHSELDLRAGMPDLAQNNWNLRYRAQLDLDDARKIFRQRNIPDSKIEISGGATYLDGKWGGQGYFHARDVNLPYVWFHSGPMQTWGDFELKNGFLTVPELHAEALNGTLQGKATVDLKRQDYRIESKLSGMSVASTFAALDNPDFPVNSLHWDGREDATAVNTWTRNFQHFHTAGVIRWSPPESLAPGKIPVSAEINYDYEQDPRHGEYNTTLAPSHIDTPQGSIQMSGPFGAKDSGLEVNFHTTDLKNWDDFINAIRGSDVAASQISGRADWKGRILGPIVNPTFSGHMSAENVGYDQLHWDYLSGDMSYGPDELHLSNAVARLGHSSANLDLRLHFDGAWSFLPNSRWALDAKFTRNPTDDIQPLFGLHYPFTGYASGEVVGDGTRANPVFDGNVFIDQVVAWGIPIDHLSGKLHIAGDDFEFTNATFLKGAGRATGNFVYHPRDRWIQFTTTGDAIALQGVPQIQTAAFPLSGTLGFSLEGSGLVDAPQGRGTIEVTNLKVGTESEGNLTSHITSDGQVLHLDLTSKTATGELHGEVQAGLTGGYQLAGRLTMQNFDLDPFIIAGLHLKGLTGHSAVDGTFDISGPASNFAAVRLDANLSKVVFDYDVVKLENEGPLILEYRHNAVEIKQAYLRGVDTDFHFSGSARFDGKRPLNLAVVGKINLRFFSGLLPALNARGAADTSVSVGGTVSSPAIVGTVKLRDASANYDDFPTGLSHVTGDIVFDSSRALLENITAQAGGGNLTLNGSMSYGNGPIHYDLDASAPQIRVRYPVGMSWLLGGTLHIGGTTDGALLSGDVRIARVLFAQGIDLATLLSASQSNVQSPVTPYKFLQNLQFDIGAETLPNARMEWTGAQVEMEGSMRLRGTWDRPLLLGNIHLLSGNMNFRGNKYDLSRGEINFSNPFRLDPILNIQATTTISQYEITLDFSGPASNLTLAYRADPPLPDSDIIALLALGSTGTESALRSSSAGTTQGYGATALLSEAISSELGGRIQRLFGISRFRVDPFLAGTASEQNAAARVTIEEQVGRDLTITYSTNAASDQQQVIQVQYALRRDISIIALRDINGTYSLSVEFLKHFK